MRKSTNKNEVLPFIKEKNLTPIILGILIVIAGFATFNIFNRFAPGSIKTEEEQEALSIEKTENKNNSEKKVESENNDQKNTFGINTAKNNTWIANDYKKGDIKGNIYTIVRGDTLWEIAEAVYGSGYEWKKIAKVNGVKYLPNGNPLIVPGQMLTLPQ